MSFEVIVKYNGDLMPIEKNLNAQVEILNNRFAIITLNNESDVSDLFKYKQIEYIEKPFILGNVYDAFDASGITNFKRQSNLTGKGVLIGIIDSGIDYKHPRFINENNTTKIFSIWDQTGSGNPPKGFKQGFEYTQAQINKALKDDSLKIVDIIGHGTHVSGIASYIAPDAQLVVVKVGTRGLESFARTTEIMRGVKYMLDIAQNVNMPIAINISYGTNEGPHDGTSLFEQYINDMSLMWKNNIVVAAGNEGDKGHHKFLKVQNNEIKPIEFFVGNGEREIKLNIWKSFADNISFAIENPSSKSTPYIDNSIVNLNIVLGINRLNIIINSVTPFTLNESIEIVLKGNPYIQAGIWKIQINGINIVKGNIDVYLPISESLSKETKFVDPTIERTVTNPGTATRVVTVGSYNYLRNVISAFSGRGDRQRCVDKPDLVAPGENIVSSLPGKTEGALSGTSMSTPFVTGSVALLMEWGITKENDVFLYGDKIKSLLLRYASRDKNFINYPNDEWGFGWLNMNNIEKLYENSNLFRIQEVNLSTHTFTGNADSPGQKQAFRAFLIEYIGDIKKALEKVEGIQNVEILDDKYAVIYVDPEFKELSLDKNQEVIYYEKSLRMVPLLDDSVDLIGAKFFHNNPYMQLTGRDVIVGIVDSGIDYMNSQFIYEDDTSKILYIWDQSLPEKNPEGFSFGSEFTRSEINESIKTKKPLGTKDDTGHGTKVCGIIGARGDKDSKMIGVAPDCEFIVVKLEEQRTENNKLFYESADLLLGIKYIYDKAKKLNKPLVINISLGTNKGSHDGKSIISSYLYQLSKIRGVIPVAGAGNEGDTRTHFSGKFERSGEIQNIEFSVGEGQRFLSLQIWARKPDKLSVGLLSPTGEIIEKIPAKLNEIEEVNFTIENVKAYVQYFFPDEKTGDELIEINFLKIKEGIWTIKLYADLIVDGRYNAYLPSGALLSKGTEFLKADPFGTIVVPAVLDALVTVGAYNSFDNSIYKASSRGPTRDGILKPDLVAPGVNIMSTIPGGGYAPITGTSAAAAHVTGVVALLLQWAIVEKNDTKLYTPKVKTYLIRGARKSQGIEYPSYYWGYGVVNVRGMFENLRFSRLWRYPRR